MAVVEAQSEAQRLREFIIRSRGIGVVTTLLRETGVLCPATGQKCKYKCAQIVVADQITGKSDSMADCQKLKDDYL